MLGVSLAIRVAHWPLSLFTCGHRGHGHGQDDHVLLAKVERLQMVAPGIARNFWHLRLAWAVHQVHRGPGTGARGRLHLERHWGWVRPLRGLQVGLETRISSHPGSGRHSQAGDQAKQASVLSFLRSPKHTLLLWPKRSTTETSTWMSTHANCNASGSQWSQNGSTESHRRSV